MANLAEFNGQIEAFMSEQEENLRQFVVKIGFEALKRVVQKTPVDTGRARGNWQVSVGQPIETVRDERDKRGGRTISEGFDVMDAQAQPYGVVYISNNVDYIGPLEDGSSKQAPEGMVAVTVAEIEAAFPTVNVVPDL